MMKFTIGSVLYSTMMAILFCSATFAQNTNPTVVRIAGEGLFGGKVIKNSPFIAEFATENVQVVDGTNRIVQRASNFIYRNREGKLRQEQTFTALESLSGNSQPQTSIIIYDTPAGFYYNLDLTAKTAYRQKVYQPEDDISELKNNPKAIIGVASGQALGVAIIGGEGTKNAGGMMSAGVRVDAPKSEPLGTTNILGLEAEGVRYTFTIPAGMVGNERPLTTISESWYSKELQTIIMSKSIDPRFGEYTYKLVKFTRNEPSPELFRIPAEFRVVD